MKKTAVTKVAEFLASNPGSTREAIGKKTKLKGIELTNAFKSLRKEDKLIEDFPEGEEGTFTLKTEEATATTTPVEVPVPDEQLPPTAKKGRDNTKYTFNGNIYGKGRLVQEVVRQYVAGHPKITYKQILEIFPHSILPRFGVVRDEQEARSLSSAGRDRFFMGENDGIKVAGKPNMLYVSNQWVAKTVENFIKVARELGFKIK